MPTAKCTNGRRSVRTWDVLCVGMRRRKRGIVRVTVSRSKPTGEVIAGPAEVRATAVIPTGDSLEGHISAGPPSD